MNREALENLFEEEMDCTWKYSTAYERDGYVLRTSTLSNETITEIAACGAGVKSIRQTWFLVYDDE